MQISGTFEKYTWPLVVSFIGVDELLHFIFVHNHTFHLT